LWLNNFILNWAIVIWINVVESLIWKNNLKCCGIFSKRPLFFG
jgi:hypothetical protein